MDPLEESGLEKIEEDATEELGDKTDAKNINTSSDDIDLAEIKTATNQVIEKLDTETPEERNWLTWEAHDQWRESWFAKYSKNVEPLDVTAFSTGATSATFLSVMLLNGGNVPSLLINSPAEFAAAWLGPMVIAEITDKAFRTIAKIQESSEAIKRRREIFRQTCLEQIAIYQEQVADFEKERAQDEADNNKWLAETTDPEEQKKGQEYYNKNRKILDRMINQCKKNLAHWQSIYSKKFEEA